MKICSVAGCALAIVGLFSVVADANPVKEMVASAPAILANCQAMLGKAKPDWPAKKVSKACQCSKAKLQVTAASDPAATAGMLPALTTGDFLEAWQKIRSTSKLGNFWYNCFDGQ